MGKKADEFLHARPQEALRWFMDACSQVEGLDVDRIRKGITARLRCDKPNPPDDAVVCATELERDWYQSVDAGKPNFGIYRSEAYLSEAWFCWARYSRRYLAMLSSGTPSLAERLVEKFPLRRVVDVGCGIGYSTVALAELFPEAKVFGTQLDGTAQGVIARKLAARYGFTVAGSVNGLVKADLVFASEYFEHFAAPLDHLDEVLVALRPNVLILANAFTARSAGHFPVYVVDGKRVVNTKVSRLFGAKLRRAGYAKVRTTFWNQRPEVWVRIAGPVG